MSIKGGSGGSDWTVPREAHFTIRFHGPAFVISCQDCGAPATMNDDNNLIRCSGCGTEATMNVMGAGGLAE